MAIAQRKAKRSGIVHADHGVQFTSWAFTDKVRQAGLMPSFGSVGDAFDNAMMESFWSTMRIELLDRMRWKTSVELSNAIFEFIEVSTIAAVGTRSSATSRPSNSNDL